MFIAEMESVYMSIYRWRIIKNVADKHSEINTKKSRKFEDNVQKLEKYYIWNQIDKYLTFLFICWSWLLNAQVVYLGVYRGQKTIKRPMKWKKIGFEGVW